MKENLKVILYGAGNFCREMISELPDEWSISAIADKNCQLWGDKLNGYQIINPYDIKQREYDIVIIMSYLHKREIMKELQDMGIDTWRIVNGGEYLCDWDRKLHYMGLTKKYLRISRCKTVFENRKTKNEKLLYILIGYKDFLWEDTLKRVKLFCPQDIDVCLLSSGVYINRLSEIANTNNWSYFSTNINNILDAQNLLMAAFPEKNIIYKMDEDVYVTKNCFEKMFSFYEYAEKNGEAKVGYISPIVPLNTSSYIFLEEFNLKEVYKKEFNRKLVYGGDIASPDIRKNPRFSEFYWSIGNIDELNKEAEKKGSGRYCYVSGRHAICFIMFSRDFYNTMGGYIPDELDGKGYDWKDGDEFQIMKHCINFGYFGTVILDTVCGHFCYSMQETVMKKFRVENPQFFDIHEA